MNCLLQASENPTVLAKLKFLQKFAKIFTAQGALSACGELENGFNILFYHLVFTLLCSSIHSQIDFFKFILNLRCRPFDFVVTDERLCQQHRQILTANVTVNNLDRQCC